MTFLKGASAMGGICLMIGFAKVVGIVLTVLIFQLSYERNK